VTRAGRFVRRYEVLLANVIARIGALVALGLSTLLVARTGGAAAVGTYALLRVLPGLVGVVMSAGLPGAVAYFLAGPTRNDRRLPATLVAIALSGGIAGTALWTGGSIVLGSRLFRDVPLTLILVAGATVLTQLIVATAKSCSQGSDDLRGANWVIFNEEFMFLPTYGAVWAAGVHGYTALISGLVGADVITFVLAWRRLTRRGFFRRARKPSPTLGRAVAAYGLRSQVGGVLTLFNLRLDFIILNLFAGPAVLGVYAIASKFAELLKVPGMALTYVLYPSFAREGLAKAAARTRVLAPRAGLLLGSAVVPLWLSAGFVIPLLYGSAFKGAIVPAQIILLGLAFEGVAGVLTGFLYWVGRPGLNSCAMAIGLGATVTLDVLLIPSFEATGAAIASAVAYATSTIALIWFYRQVTRSTREVTWEPSPVSGADAR
jgi:O-antigen/teichoic acid export membrane protein